MSHLHVLGAGLDPAQHPAFHHEVHRLNQVP